MGPCSRLAPLKVQSVLVDISHDASMPYALRKCRSNEFLDAAAIRKSSAIVEVERTICDIHDFGWCSFEANPMTPLEGLASRLGEVVSSRRDGPAVDLLSPTPVELARDRSMSAVYGIGPLPFHSDASNFRVPPRLVVRVVTCQGQRHSSWTAGR